MNDHLSRPPMHGNPATESTRSKGIVRLIVLLALALLLFGGVFFFKWFGNRMMVQYLENMPLPPATVSAATVETLHWSNQLEAFGTLVAVNGADLTSEAGGIVKAIHFESGDSVEKGQLLLSLDAEEQQGELKRLRAQAELAELNRKRREQLFKLEAISKSDYDAAVAEANAAKAAAEAQVGRVAQKQIHAPFSGVLGIRRVNPGQYVSPGTPIVTLQSMDPMDVDFSLPEQHTGLVQPGFKVAVRVAAQPERRFEGEVLAVEPKVDEATRNFGVRARLPNPEGLLRAGQFGRVTLQLPGSRDVVVIPRTAVNYASYGTSVFVIQPRKAEGEGEAATDDGAKFEAVSRFVKLGDSRGDFVVVLDGLEPGDQVATSGLMKLSNHQPVIINNDIKPKVELDPNPPQT